MASSKSASFVKYPYPEEVNVRDFVPVILSKQNYFVWKKLMLRLFESQGLVGFFNGKVPAPLERITVPNSDIISKEMENKDYQDWKRSDALLQRWVLATISEDVLPNMVCLKTAKDIWSKLISLHERKIEYPFPAEINVRDFVPIKLSVDNSSTWQKLMLRLIESQGLVGFINGQVSQPVKRIMVPDDGGNCSTNVTTEIENEDYKAWKKTDALLQSWILGTILEDDIELVLDYETTKEIWEMINWNFNPDSSGESNTETEEDPTSQYLPLHKAALTGDWEAAKESI
ncbi:uncharacterized protein LOC132293901 isoform X2 [Cornus florida]|uniref:uncharacterized protein LOC132293901 isoform X2 n=1 Tax=Cornus florida TaxID=4283 RepID=UPI0028A0C7C8|nr:uncharacterized protein LOC132293901 isoform X2 [Cornus florida]